MIGADYLMIIIMWCNFPGYTPTQAYNCRISALTCLVGLHDYTTDDVVKTCLLPRDGKD